jgi:hypothetical protein
MYVAQNDHERKWGSEAESSRESAQPDEVCCYVVHSVLKGERGEEAKQAAKASLLSMAKEVDPLIGNYDERLESQYMYPKDADGVSIRHKIDKTIPEKEQWVKDLIKKIAGKIDELVTNVAKVTMISGNLATLINVRGGEPDRGPPNGDQCVGGATASGICGGGYVQSARIGRGPRNGGCVATRHAQPRPSYVTSVTASRLLTRVSVSTLTSAMATTTRVKTGTYEVADMSLAEWGRKEYDMAEIEMPGLMSCRDEFGPAQVLKGARISGSLRKTIHVNRAE